MKILLATIIDNINFGTYLQAYATVKILESTNVKVEILDYIRPYLTGTFYVKRIIKDKSQPTVRRVVKSIGYGLLNKLMIWNLKRFIKKRVKFTKVIRNSNDLLNLKRDFDLYLTGSDQVWNTQHNLGIDPVFFFEGIEGRKKSFSSSIGQNSFSIEEQPRIKNLLTDYRFISVRESFGVDTLKRMGISNVVQMLDPTLLIKSTEWKDIIKYKDFSKEKYLLVYSVETEKNFDVYKIAQKIALEKGLKIFLVCPTLKFKKDIPIVDRLFSLASIDTFISLIAQAEYVVCSSFHGTAFSINFNKQFLTVAPQRFNSRVESLLKLVKLEHRYVKSEAKLPVGGIDYTPVNKLLALEREKSMLCINEIIKMD